MADPTPAPPQAAEPYRPISALAIVGFGLALIFTGITLFSAIAGLRLGVPVFFPMGIFLIAVAGVVLSYLAINQINAAEGTRAGLSLARWGYWISLFSGLGYFAYYYFTGLALTQQANAFLLSPGPDSGFFEHLIAGSSEPVEFNRAFLLSLPATSREGAHPDRPAEMRLQFDQATGRSPGAMFNFRLSDVVRVVTCTAGTSVVTPEQIHVEPMGVNGWSYEKNHYIVSRIYRFSTPEGLFDLLLNVESTEGGPGEARKWFLASSSIKARLPNELGEAMAYLRGMSKDGLNQWLRDPAALRLAPEVPDGDASDWPSLGLDADVQKGFREVALSLFRVAGARPGQIELLPLESITAWEKTQAGNVRITHSFRWTMPPAELISGYMLFGHITVESDAPIDFSKLDTPVSWSVRSFAVDHYLKQS